MQKLYTTLLLFLSFNSFSQVCTIDYSQTQTGIYPDTLPTGNVGQAYSTDVTFFMPLDTMGYDFTNFHILSVSLPVGLSWQCSNFATNCDYNPQVSQHGCVNISGTPLLAGQYAVDVTVLADLTVLTGYPFVFQIYLEILPNNVATSNTGFSMIGSAGCSPITVDFTNNNPGLLAYTWDFGNGNTSTVENPVPQVYNIPGDYLVQYQAFDNLTIVDVYTLTNLTINSMSNYGGGFPSFESADAYFILKENGTSIYQSTIIMDTDPSISWPTSIVLNPANIYVIEIWEADASAGDLLYGADDYMGNHTLNLTGCGGCTAGTSSISYSITHQVINPSPIVISEDTVHVYGYPPTPIITYDGLSHTLSTPDLGYGYQWYFNDSPINGATTTSYVVPLSGIYHVIAINNTGCVSFSDTLTAVYCNPSINPTISAGSNGQLVANNIPAGYTIQWNINAFEINGQTNDTIAAIISGNYSVAITDSFGCVHTSPNYAVYLGINESNLINWNIYPNPANETVTIEINQDTDFESVLLTDLTGRIVKQWDWTNSTTMTLDISEIPKGYFILRMKNKQMEWSRKLLIE
ncbi:MAG: hypothetical protein RI883_102 [Bacteroidota bacterium]|jgi:hypothetical protein